MERESAGALQAQVPATGTPSMDRNSVAVGGLQQLLHGNWMGPQWSREGLAKRMRWLVADEADMLLSGGFAAATNQLLEVPPPTHTSLHTWGQVLRSGVLRSLSRLPWHARSGSDSFLMRLLSHCYGKRLVEHMPCIEPDRVISKKFWHIRAAWVVVAAPCCRCCGWTSVQCGEARRPGSWGWPPGAGARCPTTCAKPPPRVPLPPALASPPTYILLRAFTHDGMAMFLLVRSTVLRLFARSQMPIGPGFRDIHSYLLRARHGSQIWQRAHSEGRGGKQYTLWSCWTWTCACSTAVAGRDSALEDDASTAVPGRRSRGCAGGAAQGGGGGRPPAPARPAHCGRARSRGQRS